MKRKKIKSSIAYFCGVILIISLSYLAYYSYNKNTSKVVSNQIGYSSLDDSTYEVYYSNSKMFDGKSNNDNFVQKYTDKVKFNFDYDLDFTDKVDGSLEAVVKSYLVIYAPNSNDEIWKSDVDYLEKYSPVTYQDSKNFHKNSSVEIDYKKYLDMYNKFKSETSIVSPAKIYVEFVSSSIFNYKKIEKQIKNDTITYSVPISSVTYSVSKKSTASGDVKTVKKYEDNKFKKMLYGIIFILSIVLDILVLLLLISRYYHDNRARSLYNSKLKKILRSYDSIIVNVKKIPDLSEKTIVNVVSFDELLDAQSELRLPINYAETVKGYEALFVIVKDDMSWVYKLVKEKKRREC